MAFAERKRKRDNEESDEDVIEVKKEEVVDAAHALKQGIEATKKSGEFLSNAEKAFGAQEVVLWNSLGDFERMQKWKK